MPSGYEPNSLSIAPLVCNDYSDLKKRSDQPVDRSARYVDQARARSFDVVVVEVLDRLSRDMEDLAGIHKRLSFLGIEIRAVHEGVVNTVLIGLRGLVGQLYREDNAHKVRRGLAGRVSRGLSAGGRAYGYAPAKRASGPLLKLKPKSSGVSSMNTLLGGHRVKLHTT
jgi:site-specific DNA recombinase